ncbi:unnamed protein product, partial [Larinioides sclopetarius]
KNKTNRTFVKIYQTPKRNTRWLSESRDKEKELQRKHQKVFAQSMNDVYTEDIFHLSWFINEKKFKSSGL